MQAHRKHTKAGLSMLTNGAALELAPYNIRVNTLAPGLTMTDINRNQWENNSEVWRERITKIPLGRAGLPEDYVGAAILLASDESSWITGSCLAIGGGQGT